MLPASFLLIQQSIALVVVLLSAIQHTYIDAVYPEGSRHENERRHRYITQIMPEQIGHTLPGSGASSNVAVNCIL